jgi:hypothetical protein
LGDGWLQRGAPLIGSIVPSGALRGESGQLTITGEHFGDSPYVQVGGEGVTITVTSINGGYIYADYSIETDAPSGDHPVTVSTLYGESDPVSFMVQDPNPFIGSISPDVWYGGTTYSVTITGTGFGNNPTVDAGEYASVQVNSSNGTIIDATVTVDPNAPDAEQEVLVTSNGWGGMGYVSYGGGQQTAHSTVNLRFVQGGCGDDRDYIILEYVTFGADLRPQCSFFNNGTAHSTLFTNANLTTGDTRYSWSLIRQPLTVDESDDYGLDRWVLLYLQAHPAAPARHINSGYRTPAHNASLVPPGAQNSQHLSGDAIDLANATWSQPEYNDLRNAAKEGNPNAGASWVEETSGPCGFGCVHADWRNRSPVYIH